MPTAMSQPADSSMAYGQRVEELSFSLGADDRRGLTDEEAQLRLGRNGRNKVAAEEPAKGTKPLPGLSFR